MNIPFTDGQHRLGEPYDLDFLTEDGRIADITSLRLECEVQRDHVEILGVWCDCYRWIGGKLTAVKQANLLNELEVGALLYRIGNYAAAQAQDDENWVLSVLREHNSADREAPAGMHEIRRAV